jgi:hypothetical protein
MAFTQQVSIHGRRLSITTTGGIASGHGATGALSTAIDAAVQMWGPSHVQTPTASSAVTIWNTGVTILSTGSTALAAYTLDGAPVVGLHKEIHSQASATAITINTNATTVYFQTTAGQSTALTLGATDNKGQVLVLKGLTTTLWGISYKTASVSS